MSGHSNVQNKFLGVSLGLWCTCYWSSVLQEFCTALGASCTCGRTYFWLHLVDNPRPHQRPVHSWWCLGCGAGSGLLAVQGLTQARRPVLNWKLPKLNKKYNSSHVCRSWQPLKRSIISWPFVVVVVEVALLQEGFSGLVSPNLLSEDVMLHGCKGWLELRGAGAGWDVGRTGRCWSAWTSPYVCATPRCDPCLQLHCNGLARALGVHLVLKIQDVMASGVGEKGAPAVSSPEGFVLVWSLSLPVFLSFRER